MGRVGVGSSLAACLVGVWMTIAVVWLNPILFSDGASERRWDWGSTRRLLLLSADIILRVTRARR